MSRREDPEKTEERVRFGCGAVLGGMLAGGWALRLWRWEKPLAALGIFLGTMLLLGWLSRRYGDAFWEKIAMWFGSGGGTPG